MTQQPPRALGIVPRSVLRLSLASVVPACVVACGSDDGKSAEDTGMVNGDESTSEDTATADPSASESSTSETIIVLATVGFTQEPTTPDFTDEETIIVLATCGFCGEPEPVFETIEGEGGSLGVAGAGQGGSGVAGSGQGGENTGSGGAANGGSAGAGFVDAGFVPGAEDAGAFEDAGAVVDAGSFPTDDTGLIVLAVQGFTRP